MKPVLNKLKEGLEYIAIFKKEKYINNSCYIIIDNKGLIKDISSSITILIKL